VSKFNREEKNVWNEPLVQPKKIFLPLLPIKLGKMNFVKAMEHNGKAFQYLEQKFPHISESKIK
jgi:hypothetical protein